MPKLSPLICVSILAVGLSACCRDSFREMTKYTLKPDAERPVERSVKKAQRKTSEHHAKSVAASVSDIETGSVKETSKAPDCQGEHLAYQATREYLMLAGPKPPSAPGEQGPCAAAAAAAAKN